MMTATPTDRAGETTAWVARLAGSRLARSISAVTTGLCGVIVLVSASGKLTNQTAVVELLDQVEVHGLLRDVLPFVQMAGGVAAIASLIRFPRLGVLALACLSLYFVGAVIAHLRVGDGVSDYSIPLGYVVVMAAAALFRSITIRDSTRPSEPPS